MYPAITPLDLVPYVILALPWLMAIREVRNGLKYGEMAEYMRRGYGPETNDNESTRVYRREGKPKIYRAMFRFYCLVVIFVPVLYAYSIFTKTNNLDYPSKNEKKFETLYETTF